MITSPFPRVPIPSSPLFLTFTFSRVSVSSPPHTIPGPPLSSTTKLGGSLTPLPPQMPPLPFLLMLLIASFLISTFPPTAKMPLPPLSWISVPVPSMVRSPLKRKVPLPSLLVISLSVPLMTRSPPRRLTPSFPLFRTFTFSRTSACASSMSHKMPKLFSVIMH